MFSSNTETNITVGYEDGDGTIDLAVEQQLSNTAAPYYHKVTVTVSSGAFLIDGTSQQVLKVSPEIPVYNLTNQIHLMHHPLRFGTVANGSEIGSGEYTIYNKVGTPGLVVHIQKLHWSWIR